MTCLLSPGHFFTIPQTVSPYVFGAFFAEADADGEPLKRLLRRSCVGVVMRDVVSLLRTLTALSTGGSASPVTLRQSNYTHRQVSESTHLVVSLLSLVTFMLKLARMVKRAYVLVGLPETWHLVRFGTCLD